MQASLSDGPMGRFLVDNGKPELLLRERAPSENKIVVGRDPPGLSPSWLHSQNLKEFAMSPTLSPVSELERVACALEAEDAGAAQPSLTAIAEKIAKIIGVQNEEVAILTVSKRWKHLHFLVPEALKNVGFIPLSSNSALAAKTVRESRPEIDNSFSAAHHAVVFENIKLTGETLEPIQKIISAPILFEGKVIGVIQVSRKGQTATGAGSDFTAEHLGNLLALCKSLGKFVHRAAAE